MREDAIGTEVTEKSGRWGRKPSPSPTVGMTESGPIHDLITQRAHRKWEERGCRKNAALQDWLEAEAEVQAEIRRGRRY